ncbi:hypothetical protein D3C85_125400 [compost metagenome]
MPASMNTSASKRRRGLGWVARCSNNARSSTVRLRKRRTRPVSTVSARGSRISLGSPPRATCWNTSRLTMVSLDTNSVFTSWKPARARHTSCQRTTCGDAGSPQHMPFASIRSIPSPTRGNWRSKYQMPPPSTPKSNSPSSRRIASLPRALDQSSSNMTAATSPAAINAKSATKPPMRSRVPRRSGTPSSGPDCASASSTCAGTSSTRDATARDAGAAASRAAGGPTRWLLRCFLPTARNSAYICSSACCRSARRSSTSSRPTEKRTSVPL